MILIGHDIFLIENAEHVFIINKIEYIIIKQFESLNLANEIKLESTVKIKIISKQNTRL